MVVTQLDCSFTKEHISYKFCQIVITVIYCFINNYHKFSLMNAVMLCDKEKNFIFQKVDGLLCVYVSSFLPHFVTENTLHWLFAVILCCGNLHRYTSCEIILLVALALCAHFISLNSKAKKCDATSTFFFSVQSSTLSCIPTASCSEPQRGRGSILFSHCFCACIFQASPIQFLPATAPCGAKLITDQSYFSCFPQRPARSAKVRREFCSLSCIQCHKAGQGEGDNKKCESVKWRQPTGLSLKESCDRAAEDRGSCNEGYLQ